MMLIPRKEAEYNFKGASFDLTKLEDRKFLGFVFNQFLYGEVTGIQVGHWLYRAPTLLAAQFFAKQAQEELAHVRKIERILLLLNEAPGPAHPVVKFLSTGMMSGSYGEHVAIEMALGEGLVLQVFYAMIATIPHAEIQKILEQATSEEERHVEFGERETAEWLASRPSSRRLFLGLALVQWLALRYFKRSLVRRYADPKHPVLSQLDGFFEKVLEVFERRLRALGILDRPFERLSFFDRVALIVLIPIRQFRVRFFTKSRKLTETYLEEMKSGRRS